MPDIKAKSRSKPGMTGAKFKSGLAKTGKKHESNQELTGFTADNPEIHQHGKPVLHVDASFTQISSFSTFFSDTTCFINPLGFRKESTSVKKTLKTFKKGSKMD